MAPESARDRANFVVARARAAHKFRAGRRHIAIIYLTSCARLYWPAGHLIVFLRMSLARGYPDTRCTCLAVSRARVKANTKTARSIVVDFPLDTRSINTWHANLSDSTITCIQCLSIRYLRGFANMQTRNTKNPRCLRGTTPRSQHTRPVPPPASQKPRLCLRRLRIQKYSALAHLRRSYSTTALRQCLSLCFSADSPWLPCHGHCCR